MPFAVTWVNLEIIILSAISQTRKDKWHRVLHRYGKFFKDTNLFIEQK